MALVIDPGTTMVPAPSKEKAKHIAENAIKQTKTAEEAVRFIKQSGYGKQGFNARHLDNFDLKHKIYQANGDYAKQHPGDNRWLEVIAPKDDNQKPVTTPKS